jgi:tetratricopeptide (TPR) repeat protein
LLYELLTGLTPFDSRDLRSRAYEEMQRVIREVEPPAPSTRVSTHEKLPSIAAQRNVEPRKLTSTVRGELDWIVMKCLEKDRTRRYDSPGALANDISHYLCDEPVAASPPSTAYRLKKFVRRNKFALAFAASVFLALAIGATAATIGWLRAKRAEALAQRRLEQSDAVNKFLNDILVSADPHRLEAAEPSLRAVMEHAAQMIEGGKLASQPEIVAEVRNTLGRAFIGLGRPEQALAELRRSLDLRRAARGNIDDPEIATTLNLMGMAQCELAQYDSAETTFAEALAMRRRLFGDDSAQTGEALGNLASAQMERDNLNVAEANYRRAVVIARSGKVAPEDASLWLNGLALTLRRQNKLDEAEKVYRESIALGAALASNDPTRVVPLTNLAAVLLEQGRFTEAEAPQREALRIARASLPANHPELAMAANGLGKILQVQGKLDEAEQLYRQALEMLRASGRTDDPDIAAILFNLARLLRTRGQTDQAVSLLREAVAINQKARGPEHVETAVVQALLASSLPLPQQLEEAEALYRQALGVLRNSPGPDPMFRSQLLNYSEIVLLRGRTDEAEAIAREALELCVRQGALPFELSAAQARLAYLLARSNSKLDEAEKLARDALDARQKTLPPDSWIVAVSRSLLGEILLLRGQIEQATPLLTESYPIVMRSDIAPATTKADVRERLAKLYERQGKPGEAQRLRAAPASGPTTVPR